MDSEEPFFQFDPFELELLLNGGRAQGAGPTEETEASGTHTSKGKQALLKPISIPHHTPSDEDDGTTQTSFSFPSSAHPSHQASSSSSPHSGESYSDPLTPSYDYIRQQYNVPWLDSPSADKGKGKEQPPTLPPLTFTPTSLGYSESTSWESSSPSSSSSAGPSSFSSTESYPDTAARRVRPFSNASQAEPASSTPTESGAGQWNTSRPHSMNSPSSTVSSRSMRRLKTKLDSSRVPGNVARKLLFRQRGDASPTSHGLGNYYDTIMAAAPLNMPEQWPPSLLSPLTEPIRIQNKVRSYSSPFPLSALDLVPATSNDILTPTPIEPRNLFDGVLPRELRLHVFSSLVSVMEDDHRRALDGNWSASRAAHSRNRWVGRDRAVRELVKISRVSKQWRSMILDGQLWAEIDLHAFGRASLASGLRISEHGGKFVQALNLAGHVSCSSADLHGLTDDLCLNQFPAATQLTSINLRGCTSLDSRSLHRLLEHTPLLRRLCVKGIPAVTNLMFKTIAACCPRLEDLDASRCVNADAAGVLAWARNATINSTHLDIVQLRLSGLKHVDEDMMAALGRAAPALEVLDLSYARQLRNSAMEAFVACTEDDTEGDLSVDIVRLFAREVGRDGDGCFCRRVTRLRHLALSSCPLLTDVACSNLAHSVPCLEMLEMAGIGTFLEDDGLVRLLRTTPQIRSIDLEDASEISDALLEALMPEDEDDARASSEVRPGHALERLIVSNAAELSDSAFRSLIRGCKQLRVLEADGTQISASVLREFVETARERNVSDARIVVIDCRGIGEAVTKDMSAATRPRQGWRAYGARKLKYLDGRDEIIDDIKGGQDECDETRVVLKSFHAWLAVDAVTAAREKIRRSHRRNQNASSDEADFPGRPMRWWQPGGRTRPNSFTGSHNVAGLNSGDSCTIM